MHKNSSFFCVKNFFLCLDARNSILFYYLIIYVDLIRIQGYFAISEFQKVRKIFRKHNKSPEMLIRAPWVLYIVLKSEESIARN